mmetsp:Transcript_31736/g.51349  ORF Transcript_31736/g.51349 Transcript_31736/m.51349 type:complete len:327 (-) Transcript_31736:1743-2723(-)
MSNSHCDEPVAVTRSIYISVAFSCLAIIIIIPSAFKFVRFHFQRTTSERPPKFVHYTSVAFIIDTFLCLIVTIPTYLWKCDAKYNLLGAVMFTTFYLGQYFLLLLIVFLRLFYSFRDSVWGLRRCTLGVYAAAFTVLAISLIVFACLRPFAAEGEVIILNSFVSGQIAILSLTMCALFIRKLYVVYSRGTTADMILIETITKTSILTFTAIVSQFVTTAVSSSYSSFSASTLFVLYCFFAIDVLTNYICIMLGFKFLDSQYRKVCSCLDSQCTSLILKCCGGSVIVQEFSVQHSTLHISATAAGSNTNRSDRSGNSNTPVAPDPEL